MRSVKWWQIVVIFAVMAFMWFFLGILGDIIVQLIRHWVDHEQSFV
jgi:hypothetical protein